MSKRDEIWSMDKMRNDSAKAKDTAEHDREAGQKTGVSAQRG